MKTKSMFQPPIDDKSVCDKCGSRNMVTNWKKHTHSNVVTLFYTCKCGRVRLDWVTSDDDHSQT